MRGDATAGLASAPREIWAAFPLPERGGGVLILDGSESARPHREALCRYARAVLAAAPAGLEPDLYGLGDPTPLRGAAVAAADLGGWCAANQGRASLLRPVLRQAEARDAAAILVLAAGRIFDLDDWLDSPLASRTRFVCFDGGRLTEDPRCRQASADDLPPRQAALELDGRPVRIDLCDRGAAPFAWDNPEYAWDAASWSLSARGVNDAAVRVGVLCAGPEHIRPAAVLASGATTQLRWRPCEPPPPGEGSDLSPAEAAVFRQCIREGKYLCPHCGSEHPAERLRCPRRKETGVLGEPVYRILDAADGVGPARGFALLRECGGQVRAFSRPWPNLPLPHAAVACRSSSGTAIHRFDAAARRWSADPGARFRAYHPVDDGTYAIVL